MRLRGEITSESRRPQAPSPIVGEGSTNRRHRVSFEPLAHLTADWFRLTNCSNRFDLMWSDASVYVMTMGPGDSRWEVLTFKAYCEAAGVRVESLTA